MPGGINAEIELFSWLLRFRRVLALFTIWIYDSGNLESKWLRGDVQS